MANLRTKLGVPALQESYEWARSVHGRLVPLLNTLTTDAELCVLRHVRQESVFSARVIVCADRHDWYPSQRVLGRVLQALGQRPSGVHPLALVLEAIPYPLQAELAAHRASMRAAGSGRGLEAIRGLLLRCYPYPVDELARVLATESGSAPLWVAGGPDDVRFWSVAESGADRNRAPSWRDQSDASDQQYWSAYVRDGNASLRQALSYALDDSRLGAGTIVVHCGLGHTLGDSSSVCGYLEARGISYALIVSGVPDFELALRGGPCDTGTESWVALGDTVFIGPLLSDVDIVGE